MITSGLSESLSKGFICATAIAAMQNETSPAAIVKPKNNRWFFMNISGFQHHDHARHIWVGH
jgi:hypothetical protein